MTELDKDALEKAREAMLDAMIIKDGDTAIIGPLTADRMVAAAILAYEEEKRRALPQSALSTRLVDASSAVYLAAHADVAEELSALLREAAASLGGIPEGWRTDMENAPKDGTPVWLRDVFGVKLAVYDTVDDDEEEATDYWLARDISTGDEEYIETPTHWHPVIIPAPPSITEPEVMP